jgi:hypothetical protein
VSNAIGTIGDIDAVCCDVFGTVGEWRTSIVHEVREVAARMAIDPRLPSVPDG